MLALLHLGGNAYTAPIVEELEERAGRSTTLAAVHVVRRRLEEKGLVSSELRSPGEEGGRDRRYFGLTNEGRAGLRRSRDAYARLWDGLDAALDGEV